MPDTIAISAGIAAQGTGGAQNAVLLGFLEDMAGILTGAGISTPIFTGWQPADPDTCISLFEYAGDPAGTVSRLETPGLQVKIRVGVEDSDYQKCKMLAVLVWEALHDLKNFSGNRALYLHITANSSPFSLGRDENNRPIFVINFKVKKIRT